MEGSEVELTEVWRPIPGHEGYYWLSNYGRVKNANGRILSKIDCGQGIFKVKIQSQGQRDERYLSSLMAEVFPEYTQED